jgi:hypothetical protein
MVLTATSEFRAQTAPPGGAAVPDMASAVQGAIAIGDKSHISFRFAYGEIPVTGTITPAVEGYRLEISAPVGTVPYSVEDADARRVLKAAVHSIGQACNGAVAIDSHQVITIRGGCPLASPMTAVSIISGLVALMLEVRPLFDMAAEFLPELGKALPVKQSPAKQSAGTKAGSAAA